MIKTTLIPIVFIIFLLVGCRGENKYNYSSLLNTLSSESKAIELIENNGQSRLIVSPFFQGKVIASTYNGLDGDYNGWVNTAALKKILILVVKNVYGLDHWAVSFRFTFNK